MLQYEAANHREAGEDFLNSIGVVNVLRCSLLIFKTGIHHSTGHCLWEPDPRIGRGTVLDVVKPGNIFIL